MYTNIFYNILLKLLLLFFLSVNFRGAKNVLLYIHGGKIPTVYIIYKKK